MYTMVNYSKREVSSLHIFLSLYLSELNTYLAGTYKTVPTAMYAKRFRDIRSQNIKYVLHLLKKRYTFCDRSWRNCNIQRS